MFWYQSFYGMNFLWWFFWVALMFLFIGWVAPLPRKSDSPQEDALGVLRRRYAAGEISTEEYEERKTRIEADIRASKSSAGSPTRFDRQSPA